MIRPGWNYKHQIRLADTIMVIGAATTIANFWVHSILASFFAWTIIAIAFGKARYANGVLHTAMLYNKRDDGKIVRDVTIHGSIPND